MSAVEVTTVSKRLQRWRTSSLPKFFYKIPENQKKFIKLVIKVGQSSRSAPTTMTSVLSLDYSLNDLQKKSKQVKIRHHEDF